MKRTTAASGYPRGTCWKWIAAVGCVLLSSADARGFEFAASGDIGQGPEAEAGLERLGGSGAEFFLALGDLSYGPKKSEGAWCDWVRSKVGENYPFQLVAGNHEDDSHRNGFIAEFMEGLPDRLGGRGAYGAEYYFDTQGLARFILISPDLKIRGVRYNYHRGTPHYDWLGKTVDEARQAGIPWVVVGMHKVCISMGAKSCEIGQDLMDLLIAKRVDLVLQAHDHGYQRSRQLTCAFADHFDKSCVADDGSDDSYLQGAGTIFVVAAAFGRSLNSMSTDDAEAPYFARWMGKRQDPTYGFVQFNVSREELSARFIPTYGGTFTDRFAITRQARPPKTRP